MAGQTSVSSAPAVGIPGEPADERTACDGVRVTGINLEASASIVPGYMIAYNSGDDRGVKNVAAVTDKLYGISLRAHDASDSEVGTTGWLPGAHLPVGRAGRYFVAIEENVDPTKSVRVRVLGTGTPGKFRATADASNTLDCSAFARWTRTALAADGVGEVEIDMTNAALAAVG